MLASPFPAIMGMALMEDSSHPCACKKGLRSHLAHCL